MGKPDNRHGNQWHQLCSTGNGKSGRRSSHRIGSNRDGMPGARGEPGKSGWQSSNRIGSNRTGRPGARGEPRNGHGNQCGGGTRPWG